MARRAQGVEDLLLHYIRPLCSSKSPRRQKQPVRDDIKSLMACTPYRIVTLVGNKRRYHPHYTVQTQC